MRPSASSSSSSSSYASGKSAVRLPKARLQALDDDDEDDEEEEEDDDGGADKPARCTVCKPQVGLPAEEDLLNWSHHGSVDSVDDDVLKAALADKPGLVSFAFGMRVDADLVKAALAQAQA